MKRIICSYLVINNHSPARNFIESLDIKTQLKFNDAKELLEEFGHRLPRPHADYLGNSIFELRFTGVEGKIRVFYFFFHKNDAIFTNGFVKKTKKTPKKQIDIAIKRRKIFLNAQKAKR